MRPYGVMVATQDLKSCPSGCQFDSDYGYDKVIQIIHEQFKPATTAINNEGENHRQEGFCPSERYILL